MPIDKTKISQEMLTAAMQCKDADELMALAKSGGYEITREEAEAYMAELVDYDLDEEKLQAIAGGTGPYDAPQRPKRIE